MSENKLHVIFLALIISRISYALSAWGGFLNSQQINRINAFLRKARRFGICGSTCICDVPEYLRMVDGRLFNSIQSHSHCLWHLLSPEKQHFGLRLRRHIVMQSLYAQITFVNALLFLDIYFVLFDQLCFLLLYLLFLHLTFAFVICYLVKRYYFHICNAAFSSLHHLLAASCILYSSTLLYHSAWPWFINCRYNCHFQCSLQTWLQ